MLGAYRAPVGDLDENQLNRYWNKVHANGAADLGADELRPVCHVGMPDWYNRYVAEVQESAFMRSLAKVGPLRGKTALDVGCGTGRWSVRLSRLGCLVTGVDLSTAAIERNRSAHPEIEFIVGDAASLDVGDRQFALAVCVTVLQHLTPDQQEKCAAALAHIVEDDGKLLIIENIRDHGPHVFARTIREWVALFRRNGFHPLSVSGVEYGLPIRAIRGLARIGQPGSRPAPLNGDDLVSRNENARRALEVKRLRKAVFRLAAGLSRVMESSSRAVLAPKHATHCAIVFTHTGGQ